MAESGLTYYMHDGVAAFRFQLSGALSQGSTAELDQARQTASSVFGGRSLLVDLTRVESIDAAGLELLEKWHGLGAQIVVTTRQAMARVQAMTTLPCRFLGSDRDSRGWLERGPAVLLLAVVLALASAAALTATRGDGDSSSTPVKGQAR